MVVMDLQSKLEKSHKLNDVYLTQIKGLEEDNLTLCARMQEMKVQQQGSFREFLSENEKVKQQAAELINIVSFLEKQNNEARIESDEMR